MRYRYMLAPLHITDLPGDLAAVRSIALAQHQFARQLWEQLEIVKHQLSQFVRARFGASSEQLGGQADLFVDTVVLPVPPVAPATSVASHVRRGRPALSKDLPRERIRIRSDRCRKPNSMGSSASVSRSRKHSITPPPD